MASAAVSQAVEPKTVTIQSTLTTPTQSSLKRPILITQGQKQALIDNLQLEVTERARKLRAQYALQAQSLRTRIELRVNRIPTATRKASMGELYEKYIESTKETPELKTETLVNLPQVSKQPPSPSKAIVPPPTKPSEPAPPASCGTKRPSDHFSADDDKENTPDPTVPLSNKKRPRPNPTHPSAVLSPKSSNPRNLSPMRPPLGSPQKSYLSHPTSPLKPSGIFTALVPASPAKAAAILATTAAAEGSTATKKPRATRTRAAAAASKPAKVPAAATAAASKTKAAPITRAKRGAEPVAEIVRNESRTVSAASNTSTGTTVVRKAGRSGGTGAAVPAKGKGKEAGKKVVGKKGAAAAPVVEAPAQGRRVLRKRG